MRRLLAGGGQARLPEAVLASVIAVVASLVFGVVSATAALIPAATCNYDTNASSLADVQHVVGVVAVQTGRPAGAAERPSGLVGGCLRSSGARIATEAGPGGIEPVLQGQAGEAAVRGSYDIGDKATAVIDGRTRIFDGLNSDAVSEVKNVASQSYTQQLRDSVSYAQANGLRFDLYVRPDTYLTGTLRQAVSDGLINLRFIP